MSFVTKIELLLHCPICCGRHVDEGEWATKPHHTHACQHCGHVWRPAREYTVGVQFLAGYKNPDRLGLHSTRPTQFRIDLIKLLQGEADRQMKSGRLQSVRVIRDCIEAIEQDWDTLGNG